jgi:hypothetical protein
MMKAYCLPKGGSKAPFDTLQAKALAHEDYSGSPGRLHFLAFRE